MPEHQAHALAHQSLLLKTGETVVTKEAAAKVAEDDIVDIDHSNQVTCSFSYDKKAAVTGAGQTAQVSAVFQPRCWRLHPTLVKTFAAANGRKKSLRVRRPGAPQVHSNPGINAARSHSANVIRFSAILTWQRAPTAWDPNTILWSSRAGSRLVETKVSVLAPLHDPAVMSLGIICRRQHRHWDLRVPGAGPRQTLYHNRCRCGASR